MHNTTSPTAMFLFCWIQRWRTFRVGTYSFNHLRQTSFITCCRTSQRLRGWAFFLSACSSTGSGVLTWPTMKCSGVKASKSCGSALIRVSGLLFRIHSVCTRAVVNSSSVSLASDKTCWRHIFTSLIIISNTPPWWDARGGLNRHFSSHPTAVTAAWTPSFWRASIAFRSSRWAETKFVPLSETNILGVPRRFTNRVKAWRKASVSRPYASSRWHPLVTKQVNKQTYLLAGARPRPWLVRKGPPKSRPTFANALVCSIVRASGREAISCSAWVFHNRRHLIHWLLIVFTAASPLTIQYWFLNLANRCCGPAPWAQLRSSSSMRRRVRWCRCGRMMGSRMLRDRCSEYFRRPSMTSNGGVDVLSSLGVSFFRGSDGSRGFPVSSCLIVELYTSRWANASCKRRAFSISAQLSK